MKNGACIAYTVPAYEYDRVRKGVPVEELHVLSEPKEFIPEKLTPKAFGNYARRKERLDKIRDQKKAAATGIHEN